ncbi:MAG: helix-turn-helix transcriptional regulator [Gammaproteobacteria bacterium]|jgi:putative transcriptional regulator|nr:transcriptional regulator [Gammaproteobacteria bacterium]MCH1530504.1 helix-turn-helix transcriptional regulator [Gammaproteobacteria bacterium]|tara:strand:- start:540 stop:734 length:195 start_codon:yes stop_codon:yes gene_type:complete
MKNSLRKLRQAKGLSQQKLGDILGVSRQTINSVENGKFDPSLTLAIKLTKFFDEPIDSIFEHEG